MSDGVEVGVVQLGIAAAIVYLWWSGALAVLIDAVLVGIRGEQRFDVSDALGITSPASPSSATNIVPFPAVRTA